MNTIVPLYRRKPEPDAPPVITHDSIRLADESDEYHVVSVVAVAPTWRDAWSILRGTYRPKVRRRGAMTSAGLSRILKQTWTREKMGLDGPSPLHDLFRTDDPPTEATINEPLRICGATRDGRVCIRLFDELDHRGLIHDQHRAADGKRWYYSDGEREAQRGVPLLNLIQQNDGPTETTT